MGPPLSRVCCHSLCAIAPASRPAEVHHAAHRHGGKRTMMGATERDCELVADPAAQGLGLHESEVMGVARLPPAHEAWLRSHDLQMGAIAVAARLAQGKRTFINMPENGVIHR